MQDIVTHAQETFVEKKELTNIHFSKKDNKEHIDKKRLIAIQESLAAETESELQKYKEAIKRRRKREDEGLAKTEFEIPKFKCQHCGIVLKSADWLSTHIDNIHVGGKYSIVREVVKNRRKKQENIRK